MSNTIKNLSNGDITRKALAVLHNELVLTKLCNKEYDGRFAVSGAKNGGTLLIREPNQFTVRSGAVMDTQDVTESTQTLTVATQRGIDVNFSNVELTMSMDDFSERIIKPAMSKLAAEIDSVIFTGAYKGIYNHILGTKGSPATLADVNASRAKLTKGLAPTGDRAVLLESLSMNSVISDSKALFAPASEIARQYSQGKVGNVANYTCYETEMIPTHTMGTFADTDTPVVNTSTGITSGTATIAITSGTTSGTVTEGSVFTVADVFAVNPETKVAYAHLQQFVVTAANTASSGAVTLAVSPTPITSGAKQNVSLVSAGASKAVLFETVGGSGTISTGYPQGLAFHKDAITMVTADLELPGSGQFSRQSFDGISMRYWRGDDIVNDKRPCRFDVLFGYKVVRPEWACRLSC